MAKGRSPWKMKRKKERMKLTALPDSMKEQVGEKSAHLVGCLSCAKESSKLVLIDFGGAHMDAFFKNELMLKCPVCGTRATAYQGGSTANWIWMWIPSIKKRWAYCELIRAPEDWDHVLGEPV